MPGYQERFVQQGLRRTEEHKNVWQVLGKYRERQMGVSQCQPIFTWEDNTHIERRGMPGEVLVKERKQNGKQDVRITYLLFHPESIAAWRLID